MNVDIELSLSLDVSASVSSSEFILQKEGYANAFRNPDVVQAIRSGSLGKIAVEVIQWSSSAEQDVSVGWTLLRTSEECYNFADNISNITRLYDTLTATGDGLLASLAEFGVSYTGTSKVIDVSGDGLKNNGTDLTAAVTSCVASNVVINSLCVSTHTAVITQYQTTIASAGNGSYFQADDYDGFKTAMLSKIIAEVSGTDTRSDKYYDRDVLGGCPCCGSYIYA